VDGYTFRLSIIAGWSQYHRAVADGSQLTLAAIIKSAKQDQGSEYCPDADERTRLGAATMVVLVKLQMFTVRPIRYPRDGTDSIRR
jgi:hypothetical protein